jgi:hypothetical protein
MAGLTETVALRRENGELALTDDYATARCLATTISGWLR